MTAAAQTYRHEKVADASLLRRGILLMQHGDRRRALHAVLTGLLSAALSALLIWSVVRFMELLFNPSAAESDPALAWVREMAGNPEPYQLFLIVGTGCAVTALAVFVVQLLQVWTMENFSAGLTRELGCRLLSTYLRQPYEFFINRHRSDLSASILSEADVTVSEFYRPVLQLATSGPTTLAVIAVLATVDASVVVYLGGGIIVVYGTIYLIVRHRIASLGRRRAAANRRRFRAASDGLQSIRDVKVLGLEEPYLERYDASARELRDVAVSNQMFANVPGFALRATLLVGGVVFLLIFVEQDKFLGGRALDGTAPALGALVVAAQRLMPELRRILSSTLQLRYGAATLDRVFDELTQLARPAPEIQQERIRLTRELVFEGVSYTYPGATRVGVSGIALRIRAGEKIGIVGRSGAGKTTMGDLALGLLAPTEGRLLVDGRAISGAQRGWWRNSVGVVPQDIFLIDDSVSHNIALGLDRDAIDMDRVAESARIARIDDFVRQNLPDGYDTLIGERGVRLSGGQRQRLAIARALYRDADLIVLDEATSALDTRTEEHVMDALAVLDETKTLMVIAHRLTTLNLCDRIVVLQNGSVAAIGTRTELERDCPAFRDLLPSEGKSHEDAIL